MRLAHGCRFVVALILGFVFSTDIACADAIRFTSGEGLGLWITRVEPDYRNDPDLIDAIADSVRLEGVSWGHLDSNASFKVADFLVTPSTIDLTFDHTPFYITVDAPDLHKVDYSQSIKPGGGYDGSKVVEHHGGFGISGFLDGTLDVHGKGSLRATIDNVGFGMPYPMLLDGRQIVNDLPFGYDDIVVDRVIPLANLSGSFSRTIRVPVNVTIVPEPAAALTWLAGLGLVAVGIRRRKHQRRWASIS